MSTETGDAKVVGDFVADAKAQLEARRVELQQLDMLDPVSPEEMLEAREALGPNAGNVAVLSHARDRKRGRPAGARNKRTDDFARWLLSHGQHPALTMMQIQATPAEVLVENSRRLRRRHRTKTGIEIDVMQTMTYEAALSLKVRCAEGLLPYVESKKPVDVNLDATGDFNLIVPGMNISPADAEAMIDGEFIELGDWSEDEPE